MHLEEEATRLLAQLIRHNTVNPPGNELAAQEELAALLPGAGFEVTLVGSTPERPNLVARLRGAADGPVLGLLSHVDTVLADPAEWRHDPWCGDVIDGELWGRGALDMKSQTAAEVTAAVSLAREGWRPARGDLLVIVVVDEEVGGGEGAIWLTENHPDLVRCDMLAQRGRRRGHPLRRRARLRRLRRGEGRPPVPGHDARHRRPREQPAARRQRAAEARPADQRDERRHARLRPDRGADAAASPTSASTRPTRSPRWRRCASATRSSRSSSSRRSA